MPSNIELKAYCNDIEEAIKKAEDFGASFTKTLKQTDTYYLISNSKLKLREISGETAELIYYDRQMKDEWISDYIIANINDSKNLKKILEMLFDVLVIVKKVRKLYLYKNARIHFDEVENLGTFIEFEVIVNDDYNQAVKLFDELKKYFNIGENLIIKKSYSDLLLEKS